MKKPLLFLFTVLSMNTLNAQVILDSSDIAGPGAEFWVATDDAPDMMIQPGDPGTGQEWDFSTLIDVNTDTTYIMYPNQTPYPTAFPTATLAAKVLSEGVSNYTYLNKYENYIEGIGTVMPNPVNPTQMISVPFGTGAIVIGFPSQLGTTFDDHTVVKIGMKGSDIGQPSIDSVRVTQYMWATTTVDAEGALTTPYGVFNTLRFFEKGYDTSIIDLKYPFIGWQNYQTTNDSSYNYKWWAKGIGKELVSMDYDSINLTVTEVKWLTSNPVSARSLAKNNTISIYPNPCTNYISMNGVKLNSDIQLTDMSGRVIKLEKAMYNNPTVSMIELNSGVYFIQYTTLDNRVFRSKIVKN